MTKFVTESRSAKTIKPKKLGKQRTFQTEPSHKMRERCFDVSCKPFYIILPTFFGVREEVIAGNNGKPNKTAAEIRLDNKTNELENCYSNRCSTEKSKPTSRRNQRNGKIFD